MMGNVIEGGVIDTNQSTIISSPSNTPSSSSPPTFGEDVTSESETNCEEKTFISSKESLQDTKSKHIRSKSLESLSKLFQNNPPLSHSNKRSSKSTEIVDEYVISSTFKDFLNKFRTTTTTTTTSNKQSSPKSEKSSMSSKEDKTTLESVLKGLAPDSAESFHTASENSSYEDVKSRTLSRNSSIFNLKTETVDTENPTSGDDVQLITDQLSIGGIKNETKSPRFLLGRAFSCEGSGIPIGTTNFSTTVEDSDETESEREQSKEHVSESSNDLYIAESDDDDDDDGADKTLVNDDVTNKDGGNVSEDDGNILPDDSAIEDSNKHFPPKTFSEVVLGSRASITTHHNDIMKDHNDIMKDNDDITKDHNDSETQKFPTDPAMTTSTSSSSSSKEEEEDDEMPDKPFEIDACHIDPSSAASEQVLDNMEESLEVSSSSQPSFDESDPNSDAAEMSGNVFVFPGEDNNLTLKDDEEDDDYDTNEEQVEKMPKSPLVRIGSRIIDKKTKTLRTRPRSYHSSNLQSEIKEEIFKEMGFTQDGNNLNQSESIIDPISDPIVTPKARVPFKSIQVQSLVEMDEEEGEDRSTPEKTRSPKFVGCRPKSFPSMAFLDGSDLTDLNLTSEVVKRIPDILDKSNESGYVSCSQSPPSRSLAATPSLTTPSSLTQPKQQQQPPTHHNNNNTNHSVNHFESFRGDSMRRMDEHANLEKFKAVLRRDPQGYGIRTGGNKPVYILSVAEGSVAARHGLKARDVIFMLNGTNVSQYDHESVSSFFKASRTHMEIVVLRQVENRNDATKHITNQIEYLKNHPALLACFLLDLTLQNKQNSLFFSMANHLLRQKEVGDANFQRWAYEIFTTFLDQHAPLKLQHGLEVPSISGLLSSDETSVRHSYDSVDVFLQPIIKKQLNDHLKNNGLVYEFELKNMDHLKQMKHIEKVLWKSFETLSSEEKDDKKQALAACMSTFFHLVGFSSLRGGNLLESFPAFVDDKMPVKMKKSKGHMFRSEYITNMSPCGVCKQPTWNLGTTVYKCSACSFYIHSYCLFKLTEACNFKRKTNSFVPFYVVEDPNSSFDLSKSYAGLFRSRSCQLSSKTAFIGDPDLDIPLDLPHLKDVIPSEDLKKLKNKELKFQEIVNELFHTEKLHVRSLKIMKMLYERPMRAEPSISNITNLLFPNLDELIRVHDLMNIEFEKCKDEQRVVTKIGDLLVTLFSGSRGDQLKRASALFCKDQAYSLFALRKNLRKEKLTQIIQDAALNPYSGRLSLKDFLPKEMQRITKYPLLFDNLIQNMPANTEEHQKVTEASKLSRHILRFVDTQVRDCENGRKLMDLQLRLDARQLENSTDPNVIPYRKLNLTKKKLIMDGELVWKYKRAGGSKAQDLHVVLCEDILLLLVKQEGRLVLRCHTTTIEDHVYVYYPVLRVAGLLAKDAGRDKCAFYIVDRNSPQVYHLSAKNKDLRNRWFNLITETINRLVSNPLGVSHTNPPMRSHSNLPSSSNQKHDNRKTVQEVARTGHVAQEVKDDSCQVNRRDSAPSLLGSLMRGKRRLPLVPSRSLDVRSISVEDERRIARPLHLPLPSPFHPSSSSSLSSPPPCDYDDDDVILDDLRRTILNVSGLLQEKISVSMATGNHHHHHLWGSSSSPPPSSSSSSLLRDRFYGGGNSTFASCPCSPMSSPPSVTSWSLEYGDSADGGYDDDDDNMELISSLLSMSDKEIVSYCKPQVEAIRRLVDETNDSRNHDNINAVINNSIISGRNNNIINSNNINTDNNTNNNSTNNINNNDSRHLQQLRHWKLQSLRLQSLDFSSNRRRPLSGDPNINNSNNNINNNNNIHSPTTPNSNPFSPPIFTQNFRTMSQRNQYLAMKKLVSLTTKIELALGQLMLNRCKKEDESCDLAIS